VFAPSYLASAHRKPQSYDRLDFLVTLWRSSINIETWSRLDVDSLYLRYGVGLDGMVD
jgi:hypothetical protein